jgi:hypothetical protein
MLEKFLLLQSKRRETLGDGRLFLPAGSASFEAYLSR